MSQTVLNKKHLRIAILSFLAISGVAGTVVTFPFHKRQRIPLKAR
jgi:hypothetical protein